MWSYFNPFLKVHIKYPVWAGDCFLMIHNNNKCSFFFFFGVCLQKYSLSLHTMHFPLLSEDEASVWFRLAEEAILSLILFNV